MERGSIAMKKMTALPVLLALALTTACSGGTANETKGADSAAQTPSGSTGAAGAKPPEKKTFTALLSSHPNWPYRDDWAIWKIIEEKTGVTLKAQVPAGSWDEVLNLTVASGNMPDLMYMSTFTQANDYGQQGALANILDYVDQMPNFKKWLERYPEIRQRYLSADGKMYMFPNEGFGETNRRAWMYREDIFKKNNLAIPKNYDELYTVLTQLKKLYPDSYPLSFRNQLATLENFAPNFGVNPWVYFDKEANQWKFGPTQPGFKDLLTYLNKFYKEGLIPPDWLTMTTKQWEDLMSNNKSFVMTDYIVLDTYNIPLQKQNPEFMLKFLPPPAGKPGGKQVNPYLHVIDSGLTVASTSKNSKDIMKFMDFFYSEEGREVSSWGKEGVTYTVENGKKKFKDEYLVFAELRKQTGLFTNGTYEWIDYDARLSSISEPGRQAYEEARKYDTYLQPTPAFTKEENDVIRTVGQAVKKFYEENTAKFIYGDKGLDQWDAYVADINKLGVDRLVATYSKAYERMMQYK